MVASTSTSSGRSIQLSPRALADTPLHVPHGALDHVPSLQLAALHLMGDRRDVSCHPIHHTPPIHTSTRSPRKRRTWGCTRTLRTHSRYPDTDTIAITHPHLNILLYCFELHTAWPNKLPQHLYASLDALPYTPYQVPSPSLRKVEGTRIHSHVLACGCPVSTMDHGRSNGCRRVPARGRCSCQDPAQQQQDSSATLQTTIARNPSLVSWPREGAHTAGLLEHPEWLPPSLDLDARDDLQPIDEGRAAGRTDMSSWTTAPAMLFLCLVAIRLLDLPADSGNLPDHHPHHPHLCSTLPYLAPLLRPPAHR